MTWVDAPALRWSRLDYSRGLGEHPASRSETEALGQNCPFVADPSHQIAAAALGCPGLRWPPPVGAARGMPVVRDSSSELISSARSLPRACACSSRACVPRRTRARSDCPMALVLAGIAGAPAPLETCCGVCAVLRVRGSLLQRDQCVGWVLNLLVVFPSALVLAVGNRRAVCLTRQHRLDVDPGY